MQTYTIYRYFRERGKRRQLVSDGHSLSEAQEHCQRFDTQRDGVYFDAYRAADNGEYLRDAGPEARAAAADK